MMGGATLYLEMTKLTLQDTGAKIGAIIAGGLLGLYVLGFLTTRGNGRSVAAGIACTVLFSLYITALEMKLITAEGIIQTLGVSEGFAGWLARPIHAYYTAIFGNIIMFVVGYVAATLFQRERRDLTNMTVWTQSRNAEEE